MLTNQEDIVQLANELRKLEMVISAKSAKLNNLINNKDFPVKRLSKSKRYSVMLQFVPGELVPKTNSFTVDKNSIFRPLSIDWSLQVNATVEDTIVNAAVPPGPLFSTNPNRNALFSFLLSIRDSGSNREWQNAPIPDVFLLSGMLSPLYNGIGERGVLAADTLVSFEVQPFLSVSQIDDILTTINSYTVIIGMNGHEEPA